MIKLLRGIPHVLIQEISDDVIKLHVSFEERKKSKHTFFCCTIPFLSIGQSYDFCKLWHCCKVLQEVCELALVNAVTYFLFAEFNAAGI